MTTDVRELVERLRERGVDLHVTHGETGAKVCSDAADALEAQQAEIEKLRDAEHRAWMASVNRGLEIQSIKELLREARPCVGEGELAARMDAALEGKCS